MPLNPTHLLTFAAVAQTRSLSRAAMDLDLGQPAVSSQLRQLQAAVGEPLYRRTGHGIALTQAGEALLPYAQEVARSLARAETFLQERREHAQPLELCIGVCWTLGERLPPALLRAFGSDHPGARLQVRVGTTDELAGQLVAGELQAALTGGLPDPVSLGLQVRHAGTDELVWAVRTGDSPGSPAEGDLTFEDTLVRPWLWAQPQSTVRRLVEARAQDLGVRPVRVLDLGSYAAVRQALAAGMGGAFLPQHLIQTEVTEGTLTAHRLADMALLLPYRLLLPPAHHQGTAVRSLVGLSLSALAQVLRSEG